MALDLSLNLGLASSKPPWPPGHPPPDAYTPTYHILGF